MRKKYTAKVFAFLALLGIIISVVGTGILILSTPSTPQNLTQEDLQKLIEENKIALSTGALDQTGTLSDTGTFDIPEASIDETIETGTGE